MLTASIGSLVAVTATQGMLRCGPWRKLRRKAAPPGQVQIHQQQARRLALQQVRRLAGGRGAPQPEAVRDRQFEQVVLGLGVAGHRQHRRDYDAPAPRPRLFTRQA